MYDEEIQNKLKTKAVQLLNDRLRCNIDMTIGMFVFTSGVAALPDGERIKLMQLVQEYNDFNEDNDPYGEHDMGFIDMLGVKYMWKIDYYSDKEMQFGSEDPSNEQLCWRVLTIMLADEY